MMVRHSDETVGQLLRSLGDALLDGTVSRRMVARIVIDTLGDTDPLVRREITPSTRGRITLDERTEGQAGTLVFIPDEDDGDDTVGDSR